MKVFSYVFFQYYNSPTFRSSINFESTSDVHFLGPHKTLTKVDQILSHKTKYIFYHNGIKLEMYQLIYFKLMYMCKLYGHKGNNNVY